MVKGDYSYGILVRWKGTPGIAAHSIRSVVTSVASIESICKAATWSSPSTFIRHYKIDQAASSDAAFGRWVLQKVVPT